MKTGSIGNLLKKIRLFFEIILKSVRLHDKKKKKINIKNASFLLSQNKFIGRLIFLAQGA